MSLKEIRKDIVDLKNDLESLIEDLEDGQIYGAAEILIVAKENLDEALEEFDQYMKGL